MFLFHLAWIHPLDLKLPLFWSDQFPSFRSKSSARSTVSSAVSPPTPTATLTSIAGSRRKSESTCSKWNDGTWPTGRGPMSSTSTDSDIWNWLLWEPTMIRTRRACCLDSCLLRSLCTSCGPPTTRSTRRRRSRRTTRPPAPSSSRRSRWRCATTGTMRTVRSGTSSGTQRPTRRVRASRDKPSQTSDGSCRIRDVRRLSVISLVPLRSGPGIVIWAVRMWWRRMQEMEGLSRRRTLRELGIHGKKVGRSRPNLGQSSLHLHLIHLGHFSRKKARYLSGLVGASSFNFKSI